MHALQDNVLVLNRSWRPVCITTVRHALVMVYLESARIVDPVSWGTADFESWKENGVSRGSTGRFIYGCDWRMPVPEIIVLQKHSSDNGFPVRFNRRNVLLRDQGTCQYCGKQVRPSEATLDHVVPKSRGGTSSWENLVVACQECNHIKEDRTPDEAGLQLIRKPGRPRWEQLQLSRLGIRVPPSWRTFLPNCFR